MYVLPFFNYYFIFFSLVYISDFKSVIHFKACNLKF